MMIPILGGLLAVVLAQAQPDRTIANAVVDDQGKPVAGARVVLYAPPMIRGKENAAESEATSDPEGRFRVKIPPLGRRIVNGVNLLVYRPGLAIAGVFFVRPPNPITLHKPEPRAIRVEGPDGRPIAGARVAPQVLYVSAGTIADIPRSLAEPMAVTTGPDGRATIAYLTDRDQLVAAWVTTDSIGTQAISLVERPARSSREPVIAIRLRKTGRLIGRIVDEAGVPVADQLVEVWSRGGETRPRPEAVALTGGPLRTADDGSFRTPDNLMIGSAYRVVLRGPGKETVLSDWITIGERPHAPMPIRMRSLRTIAGRVVDRQGKPVGGVEVFQTGDGPEPTSTRSDREGRFSLGGFVRGPVILFARGDGFRFHGQLVPEGGGEVAVELTRTGEPPRRVMRMLPDLIPIEESRAMARRLIEPVWKVVAEKGDDAARSRTLEALVHADPAGVLEKLESAKFSDRGYEFQLRGQAAATMATGDPEDAAAVAESIADPGPRAGALIGVIDALPGSQRALKLALLDRAVLHARAARDVDDRLRWMGHAAERLHEMGEADRARAIFAEGVAIARGMTDKTDFRRGYFAAQLALVDLPAALAIARDFSGDRSEGRILTNLAFRLIGRDPAEAERIWKKTAMMGRLAGTDEALAWRMAAVDPGRARRCVESFRWIDMRPEIFFALALGARGQDEAASRRALEDGLRGLDRLMQEQPERLEFSAADVLPVVERIDPAAVEEVFWRSVAARPLSANPRTISAYSPSYLIARLAWYDRGVAAALFEPTRDRIEHAEDRELADWRMEFLAWSLFDPRAAAARLEKVPVRDDRDPQANAARVAVAESLGRAYEPRWREFWRYQEIILGGTKRGF